MADVLPEGPAPSEAAPEPLTDSEIEALRLCCANATRGDSLGLTEHDRAGVANLAADALMKLRGRAALGEPPTAEVKLAELVAHLEALDSQLTRLGKGEFVEGYQMQTGAWHRILGLIRGSPVVTAAHLAAQIPNQRAVTEAYRKAGEVSQESLRYEVLGESPAPPDGPPIQKFPGPLSEPEKRAADWVFEYGKHMVEGDPEIPYADCVNIVRGLAVLRAALGAGGPPPEDAKEEV